MDAEHRQWMSRALELAQQAQTLGEVPVGAVVVQDGCVVGEGFNQPISSQDPTAHAEIVALRDAAQRLGNYRLPGCRLYVTIEPCTMCVGACIHARIEEIIFGAREPRAGALCSHLQLSEQSIFNHRPSYLEGVMAPEAAQLLKNFFRQRRGQGGQPV